jgi:hypothetical protein
LFLKFWLLHFWLFLFLVIGQRSLVIDYRDKFSLCKLTFVHCDFNRGS